MDGWVFADTINLKGFMERKKKKKEKKERNIPQEFSEILICACFISPLILL
jgi:hypothetical protein